jgi:hypothetical protein
VFGCFGAERDLAQQPKPGDFAVTRIALALALAFSFAGVAGSAHAGPNPAVTVGLMTQSNGGG